MTIASCVESPAELDMLEAHHICPEKALQYLLQREQELEAHAHK